MSEDERVEKLESAIAEILNKLSSLERFVDTNDQQVREILGAIDLSVKDMKSLLYGSPTLRLRGHADRLDTVEKMVDEIRDSRRSERDKLRGIQIGLGLTGLTGLGTLAAVITQILQ